MPRRAALALLAAVLVLAATAASAAAVGSVSPAARGLADSRLYVDPAVAETIDAGTRVLLRRALARRTEPVFVALVAFAPGDAFDGDGPRFLNALAGRLRRPGVYVTYDARGILWTRGYRIEAAVAGRAEQASRTVDLEAHFDGPPAPRLRNFLAALDDPDLTGREERASADFRERTGAGAPAPSTGANGDGGGSGGGGGVPAGVVVLIVVVVLLAAVLVARRRRGARPVDDRPVLPGRVFALAREASRDELADRADAMLIELSALIDAAAPSEDTQRALDAYEAAERALRRGAPDIPDLVGALVCIDLGRAALSGERELPPPCTYDPRHGPAQGRPVTVHGTELRLCAGCRADVKAGRPANVLRDGSGRPYFEDDTPWAATGYGAWADPIRAVLDKP